MPIVCGFLSEYLFSQYYINHPDNGIKIINSIIEIVLIYYIDSKCQLYTNKKNVYTTNPH